MKKIKMLAIAVFTTTALIAQVQKEDEPPVFRKGYMRFGINMLGNALETNLSPKQNVLAGNYGAGNGAVVDLGHIFYFRSRHAGYKLNAGIDWTVLSFTLNKLNKWQEYGLAANATDIEADKPHVSISFATKLGPVVAYNPVGKLVVEARFQVAGVVRPSYMNYYDKIGEESRSFSFVSDSLKIKDMLKPGLGTSFGLTVRYGFIGLSADYESAKLKTNYEAQEIGGIAETGLEKIHAKNLQLKLSLTF